MTRGKVSVSNAETGLRLQIELANESEMLMSGQCLLVFQQPMEALLFRAEGQSH